MRMSQPVVGGRRRVVEKGGGVVGEGGEVVAPSWSLRALNDGVGSGGEAFTVNKRRRRGRRCPLQPSPAGTKEFFVSPGLGPGVL